MKLTKTTLRRIIKEELEAVMSEGVKDYLKSSAIHSSIPAGSLARVLQDHPDLKDAAGNAANPAGQMQAFQKIGALLAQDVDIRSRIGDDPIEKHLDVKGYLRYAEQNMSNMFH